MLSILFIHLYNPLKVHINVHTLELWSSFVGMLNTFCNNNNNQLIHRDSMAFISNTLAFTVSSA